jgi:hypothetical protein
MNKMYLVLGDWSDDGHGKHDKILLESNVSVKDIQQAYKDSCKLTGVSFNHNEDFTETNHLWEDSDKYRIADEYEDSQLSKFVFDILAKHGLTKEMLKEWEPSGYDEDKDGNFFLYVENFVELWIWFVKLSLPKNTIIKTADEKNEIPCINGYWDKNLNVQFGYGLYI